MFYKIPMNTRATISAMLLCYFVYAEVLFEKTLSQKSSENTCDGVSLGSQHY